MERKKRTYEVNLEQGRFLIGVEPHTADFVLFEGGRLERIVKRTPLEISYDVLIHTDNTGLRKGYLAYQILDYAKKLPDSSTPSS
ncbi:MAG: hypothetical protein NTW17_02735 [Candidatus Pacearchaeota archaeon]|nr:hypothetical protein [Candidatus Pacearchaeota archaeon]